VSRFLWFPFCWQQREGGGCRFWEWEEGYEQYLVDQKLVPPDYQPVFESTKLPQQVPVVENKLNYGERSQDEQVEQLRKIVKLLKCVLLVCVLVLVCNLAAIVRSE
jgi:2-oxoglutarate dehydrogenase complex dehydrogenase (E1) component-like enzyme